MAIKVVFTPDSKRKDIDRNWNVQECNALNNLKWRLSMERHGKKGGRGPSASSEIRFMFNLPRSATYDAMVKAIDERVDSLVAERA